MTDLLDAPTLTEGPPPPGRAVVVVAGCVATGIAAVGGWVWLRDGDLLPLPHLATATGAVLVLAAVGAALASGRRLPLAPAALAGAGLALGGALLAGRAVGHVDDALRTSLAWHDVWVLEALLERVAPPAAALAVLLLAVTAVRLRSRPAPTRRVTATALALPAVGVAASLLVGTLAAPSLGDTTPAPEVAAVWDVVASSGRLDVRTTSTSSTPAGDWTSEGSAWFDVAAARGEVTYVQPDGGTWVDPHDWGDGLAVEDRSPLPYPLLQLQLALHGAPTWERGPSGELVATLDPTRLTAVTGDDLSWPDDVRYRWDQAAVADTWPHTEARLVLDDEALPVSLTVVSTDAEHRFADSFVYRRAGGT